MGDLGKLIVSTSFKKLPKVKKIAQSGQTAYNPKTERVIGIKYDKDQSSKTIFPVIEVL